MAYFGLAHLGPQSSFLANRTNAYHCGIFELEDFYAAVRRVCGADAATVPLSAAPRVLDFVFHGPPPPLEASRVGAALEAAAGGRAELPAADFFAVIAALQREPPAVDEDAYAHYKSFDLLRAHKLRQVRPMHGPEEVQREPATLHQEIGFQARKAAYEVPRFVKKCEETKFKAELIKAGVWY